MIYYVDASAWVKRYYREIGTIPVQQRFTQNTLLACATLGLVEVTATLARKRKAGAFDDMILEQKLQELSRDWDNFIQIQCTDEVMHAASALTRAAALKGADAIHLAAALRLQQRLEQSERVILITSDRELRAAAQVQQLAVLDPVDQAHPDTTETEA